MKNFVVIVIIFVFSPLLLFAQADGVVGIWLTADKDSQIEIYKTASGTYEGKIAWMKEPLNDDGRPKRDKENPDRSLRNRPLQGLVLLRDFEYNPSSREWKDGTVYDPENGRTYSAYMWLDGRNTLNLKGYVMGMRFLGRTTSWTRDTELRE